MLYAHTENKYVEKLMILSNYISIRFPLSHIFFGRDNFLHSLPNNQVTAEKAGHKMYLSFLQAETKSI